MNELVWAYVGSDEQVHEDAPPMGLSRKRQTARCDKCGERLRPDFDAPFAHCACGTQEWYK